MDFSQNSIVVIDFSISQMWKQKKRVDRSPKKDARVSPKSNKNICKKGVLASTEVFNVSDMVQMIMCVVMTAYRSSKKKYLWFPKPTQL